MKWIPLMIINEPIRADYHKRGWEKEAIETMGAFHLVKISGISGSAVNGTRFVGSSHWKIPRKSGKSKKVVPFSLLEIPNRMSCSIYVSRSFVPVPGPRSGTATHRGLRPNGTTFCQSEIPLLLPPKFPGFFPKWKAPNIYISGKRAGWLSVRKLSPLPTPAKLVKLRKKNTVLRSPGVAMRKKVSYFHRSPVTRQSGRFEGRCSPMVLSQGPTL